MELKRYIQVFIKTEADLPKEKDKYFVKYKNGIRTVSNFNLPNRKVWLKDIDWYLLPEPVSNVLKSAEEWLTEHNYNPDLYYTNEAVINIMNQYASQSKEVTLPSEKEIEKKFPTDLKVLCELNDIPLNFNADQGEFLYSTRAHNKGKQDGAKWFKSQLKELRWI